MAVAALPTFRTKAFIDGQFRDAASGETFVTENPATGQPIATIASGGAADIDAAVRAARRAFDDGRWSRRAPAERKEVLLRFADLLEANLEELALLDSLEGGKPITDTREVDVPEAVNTYRWFAEAIDKVFDAVAPTGPDALGLIVREPIGVVGAVVPWNFPLLMATWKAAPALAAGNSLIIKPARLTSMSALRMAELASEAGLPDGVFNVVPGSGSEAGQALGRHMDVDMVTFTGSTETGRQFLHYSAESNLKEVALEMGGKSPQVVLADPPELDRVAEQVLLAGLMNMGENCSAGSRLLVHRSVRDDLVEHLVEGLKAWPVGDPLEAETRLGPMVEKPHLDKVLGYIEKGRAEGARIVTGGERTLDRDRRLLRGADDLRRRAQHDDDRARGDLRPGHLARAVRRRGRGDRAREPDQLRPCGLGVHDEPRPCDPLRAGDPRRHGRRERLFRGRHHDAVRRLQGVGLRRPRQGPRGVRAVHREEDDLVRAGLGRAALAGRRLRP